MNHLIKLLASNRRRGRFAIETKADTDEATVYLYDMIVDSDADAEWWGGVSAEGFVKQFAGITASTIHLRVNSPGGSVFGGRAMEQAIRQHAANVIVHVDGLAASAASFLIMAADRIEMAPGSFLMIHKAWSMAIGNEHDMRKVADLLGQIDGTLAATYAHRTGIERDAIADMLTAETWIEAGRAVELKFADLVTEDGSPSDLVSWDLSAFAHAPRLAERPPAAAPAAPPRQVDREALRRNALKALIPA